MATVYKTTLIPAVAVLRPVDMGAEDLFFSKRRFFGTQEVEFDSVTIDGTTSGYNSFANSAKVVKKDGFDTIRLNPLNINEAINITAENSKNRGFNEPKYGGSMSGGEQAIQNELEGFSKLKARADRTKKRAMYEALTTGKIVYGQDGIAEIDFNMPVANKEVLTGTDLWSDTDSDPVAKLVEIYDGMIDAPTDAILSQSAYQAFIGHSRVRFGADANGKIANVNKNAVASAKGSKFIFVGTLADRPLDLWLEIDTYVDSAGARQKYLTDGFVVIGSSTQAEMLYGGIPTVIGDNVEWQVAEFLPAVATETNPAKVDRIYKTAPLPTLKNGGSFYSLKAL